VERPGQETIINLPRCAILQPLSAHEKLAMRDTVSRLVRLGAKVVGGVDFDLLP
jgi:hypothetical protein